MNMRTRKNCFLRWNTCLLACMAAWLTVASIQAQTKAPAVTFVQPETSQRWTANLPDNEKYLLSIAPPNFYHFGAANIGEITNVERFTLKFAETTKLTKIASSPDFKLEPESSCAEGRTYTADTSCVLIVHFTPQGPGHRLGHLTISHDQSSTPIHFAFGGYAYAPVISFVPSEIVTVSKTLALGVGVLSGAGNLAVSGDTLLIGDSGNGHLLSMDSSGNLATLATGYTGLYGVTADQFGQIYFDVPSTGKMYEIYDYGPVVQASGTGAAACPYTAPCSLSSEALGTPGEMSMTAYNQLFFVDSHQGAAFSQVQPVPANLTFLYDPFPYQQSPSAAMVADNSGNLFSLWANGSVCEIVEQGLYDAEHSNVSFIKVAGGHTCGFSGDGGVATNAEVGNLIGQMAFDAAGNLYFTDKANNRVRRIDYSTGVIRTIAGNGVAGFSGDGSGATSAQLANPTGVGVDSLGQVFIIAGDKAASTTQVVRRVTTFGKLVFPSTKSGTTSASSTILVTNTGNTTMTLTGTSFTNANPTEFKVDPTTTTCNLTPGSYLSIGQSCQISFVFAPAGTGLRSAYFNLLSNTTQGVNLVILSGVGLAPATATFIAPSSGASLAANAKVTMSVSVTAAGAHPPTGPVTFKVDGKQVGAAVALVSGVASTSMGSLPVGSHTFTASYSGDKWNSSATASQTTTVK